ARRRRRRRLNPRVGGGSRARSGASVCGASSPGSARLDSRATSPMVPGMNDRADADKEYETIPLWMDGAVLPTFDPLRGDAEADVCIVGAGIVGLTAAYLLGKAGRRVVVLERGAVAAGNTR